MPKKNKWQKVQLEKVDAAGAAAVQLLTLEEVSGDIAQIFATLVVLAKKVDDIDGKLWAVKTGMEGFET